MKETIVKLTQKVFQLKEWEKPYKDLRKHLDKMPVGFPPTFSGVELRLLKMMFTIPEAQVAVYLDYKPEPLDTIFNKGKDSGVSKDKMQALLDDLYLKGSIFAKQINGQKYYYLAPLAIGMYEHQVKQLTPDYYLALREYAIKKFGLELFSSNPPQLRTIPIEKSITPENKVSSYDEIRTLIRNGSKKISVTECICKKAKDLVNEPCKTTNRRELCLYLGDFHDTFAKHAWSKPITEEAALELIDQAEKDGLVLLSGNAQEAYFICACCHCCCGLIEFFGSLPGPAHFISSNYYAQLDFEKCNACGKCVKRCQFDALDMVEKSNGPNKSKNVIVKKNRCVGCGLCVSTCKTEALTLLKKEKEIVPPKTHGQLLDEIMNNKNAAPLKYTKTAWKIWNSRN